MGRRQRSPSKRQLELRRLRQLPLHDRRYRRRQHGQSGLVCRAGGQHPRGRALQRRFEWHGSRDHHDRPHRHGRLQHRLHGRESARRQLHQRLRRHLVGHAARVGRRGPDAGGESQPRLARRPARAGDDGPQERPDGPRLDAERRRPVGEPQVWLRRGRCGSGRQRGEDLDECRRGDLGNDRRDHGRSVDPRQ